MQLAVDNPIKKPVHVQELAKIRQTLAGIVSPHEKQAWQAMRKSQRFSVLQRALFSVELAKEKMYSKWEKFSVEERAKIKAACHLEMLNLKKLSGGLH